MTPDARQRTAAGAGEAAVKLLRARLYTSTKLATRSSFAFLHGPNPKSGMMFALVFH